MKRALLLPALALLLAGAAASPPSLSPARVAEMRRLEQAAMHSDYAWQQLEYLCDHIGPRLSGSPQAAAAVDYVASELSRLGLRVTREKVSVPHWVRGEERAELVSWAGQPPGTTHKIVLTALGGSVATPPQGLTAPVAVLHSFDDLERIPVKGCIVLFDVKFDQALAARGHGLDAYEQQVGYRWEGADRAAAHGAVAMLVRSVGAADFRLPHTGSMGYEGKVPKIPAAAVSAEDADLMARLGTSRMHLVLTPQTLPDAESANVIADIPGKSDEIVLVSGHLDSWDLATGAIDDGAGVAIAMETAQLIEAMHVQLERTIRVVAWMNEENGSRGARTYAKEHQADHHFAAIESDLGAGAPSGFAAHVDAAHFEALAPMRDVLGEVGAPVLQPSYDPCGADVAPLDEAGVPTFGVLQDDRTYFYYHHTAADTLDKVDPDALRRNCAAVSALTWGLAHLHAPLH